jgi:hypothetical protein
MNYQEPTAEYFTNLSTDTGLTVERLKALHRLYYSSKATYKGVNALYNAAKEENVDATQSECKKFLASQPVYSLYRPARRKVEENRIRIETVGTLQIDLFDVQEYKKDNDGIRYLLCGLDSFSRYLFVWPQQDKTPESVIKGLEAIMSTGYKIDVLYCDKDGGFYNKKMDLWRKKHHIPIYSVQTKVKGECQIYEKPMACVIF